MEDPTQHMPPPPSTPPPGYGNGTIFMAMTAIITLGYLISRGIAKASRVLEQ
jgi:hypothetical protein